MVEVDEVGGYEKRDCVMGDLKGEGMEGMGEMVGGGMVKWNDMGKNKEKWGVVESKEEGGFVISRGICVRRVCGEVVG